MEERHTIKLVIAGRTYTKVLNQEQEAIARKAAKRLEDNISNLGSMYPSVSALDILTVVALNESMEVLFGGYLGIEDGKILSVSDEE